MTDPDRLLLMGRVTRPHGVRGEMKVAPETDDPQRFDGLDRLFVGAAPESAQEREVEHVRFQYPKGRTVVLLSVVGIDSVEAAGDLRGLSVYADPDDLPPLADGEAYLHDMIGLTVIRVDEDGAELGELGTVRDLYDGSQLLFAIARPDGPDVLLPDVDEFVVRLDQDARRLYVRPPEGLIEDEG